MSKVMDIAVALTEDNPPQLEVAGDPFLVDVTLGIAVYPSHADDAATLFRRAELALKEAREKELAFDIYRPDATQQQAALWKFESELQSAVARGQLEVYFQPKVEIASHRVCGVEALVRWRTRVRQLRARERLHSAGREHRCDRAAHVARLRSHRRAAAKDGAPSRRRSRSPSTCRRRFSRKREFLPRVKALKSALDERKIRV